jgi:hypothetical protein
VNLSSFGRRLLQAVDATTFGTILGLGTAAYKNTGTSGNTVPLLDGANTWSAIQTFSANPSVTGGAISFPAAQVASGGANDLDDYEEGTFTPAFSATGCTFSYSSQSGKYTKIGRVVTFEAAITLNTSGNTLAANNLSITGLPFSSNSNAVIFPIRWFGATASYIALWGRPSGTTLIVEGITAAGTGSGATVLATNGLHATNGSQMIVTGFYIV